ncbi:MULTISPECIES: porin family protein [unclassified Psychrobacter]|uniref:porin family protein n=1 Tax=unclassified Psychrobacter TaxID=196806 RepID=UPI00078E6A7C|nr:MULTISPECIES: porin family protein [unclassified Psychrobacter]AMN50740.1 cell envelope biogenesis protein OmpA [Psychrobacter sp. P2G3]AMN68640.1 cell envelope biogenesis protein OmpA [Psychrobacter sp. P11G5]
MKTLQKTLLALAAGSLLSVSAQAAVSYGNGYTGQPYVGVKVGQFDLDRSGTDDPTAYGVYGGYNFDPNFGIEAEYVGSDDADYYNGEVDAKTYGAYGTYRYAFPNTGLYAKGKLGVAKTEVEGKGTLTRNFSDSDTSIAGGVGLGYSVNSDFSVEAEYDMLGNDADLMTVGAQLKF